MTLHFIDKEVDNGEIITIIPTVTNSRSITEIARAHYLNEIDTMIKFESYLEGLPPRRRMPKDLERELMDRYGTTP